jgi:hypothetical protein
MFLGLPDPHPDPLVRVRRKGKRKKATYRLYKGKEKKKAVREKVLNSVL